MVSTMGMNAMANIAITASADNAFFLMFFEFLQGANSSPSFYQACHHQHRYRSDEEDETEHEPPYRAYRLL